MKLLFGLFVMLSVSLNSFAQNGVYVKYESKVEAEGEDAEMMKMMLDGATMEVASNGERTYVKNNMGTMMTMEMQFDLTNDSVTMLMGGMMGKMAFAGTAEEDTDDEKSEDEGTIVELTDETKTIMGYVCKKAIMKDEEGNEMLYWYTTEFARPEGMDQMPDQIPGFCMQMQLPEEDGVQITYTAIDVKPSVDMSKYKVVIPDGVEIMPLESMLQMGMGGK